MSRRNKIVSPSEVIADTAAHAANVAQVETLVETLDGVTPENVKDVQITLLENEVKNLKLKLAVSLDIHKIKSDCKSQYAPLERKMRDAGDIQLAGFRNSKKGGYGVTSQKEDYRGLTDTEVKKYAYTKGVEVDLIKLVSKLGKWGENVGSNH